MGQACVYGYALQNPARYVDPRGENALAGAMAGGSVGGPLGAAGGAAVGGALGYFGGKGAMNLWSKLTDGGVNGQSTANSAAAEAGAPM